MDSTSLTAIVGLLGVLLGALVSPYMNNRLNARYSKVGLMFERKLEYFEKVIETMEKNRKMYTNAVCKIENMKKISQIEKIIDEIKKERKNFQKTASPLYFNTQKISEKIIYFVRIEKNIFILISELKEHKDKKESIIERLKEDLRKLNKKGNEILVVMKKELSR